MNLTAVIIASCFLAAGTAVFLFLLLGKNKLTQNRAKNYFRATAGVYLSALLLLFVLSLVMEGLPTEFIIIAEVMIATVFSFSTYILYRVVMQLDDIQKDIDAGKVRSAEQVAREDAEFEQRSEEDKESGNKDVD